MWRTAKVHRLYNQVLKLVLSLFFVQSSTLLAMSANHVWYEFHPGFIRVLVDYTVPELRERREAYIELSDTKKAAQIFWNLVKGAEFFIETPDRIIFDNPPPQPDPW